MKGRHAAVFGTTQVSQQIYNAHNSQREKLKRDFVGFYDRSLNFMHYSPALASHHHGDSSLCSELSA
jgi:hypothetical protein